MVTWMWLSSLISILVFQLWKETCIFFNISSHCNGKKMWNLQCALQFIWIFIYQNFKISHRCVLEIFSPKRIMSRLFSCFSPAMPEFWNICVILTANYVMITKPIFLQVSPTNRLIKIMERVNLLLFTIIIIL